MDIAAWQALYRNDPTAAATEFHRRRAALPPTQAEAVWSYISDDDVWDDLPANAPLAGVPFAIKDLFHLQGAPTRAGGQLPVTPARRDGTLVAALRQLGAVPVGKTHLHEFAYGLTGENPHFGDVMHPRFADRTAGGSSSGSAAAVAAGIVPFALGTDTGGSLRVPAAFCGLFSWREVPHHAWISDAFPLAPSFDTAGWLTRTGPDLLRIHRALHGPLRELAQAPRAAWLNAAALGIELAPDAISALHTAAGLLHATDGDGTAELVAAIRESGWAYGVLQSTEAYAVHQAHLDSARDRYGEVVWQRIDRGRRWTVAQLDQARLKHLQVQAAFTRFFATHDFLVLPVSPTPALRASDCDQARRDALLTLTTPASLAGRPVLTVPVPLPDGLSLGLQVVFDRPDSPALGWVLDRCGTC